MKGNVIASQFMYLKRKIYVKVKREISVSSTSEVHLLKLFSSLLGLQYESHMSHDLVLAILYAATIWQKPGLWNSKFLQPIVKKVVKYIKTKDQQKKNKDNWWTIKN